MNLACLVSVSCVVAASFALIACSSSPTSPPVNTLDSGATPSDAGPTDSGHGKTGSACEAFGGSCVKGSSTKPSPACPAGTVPVIDGDGCPGTFDACCVPARSAGAKDLQGDLGLLCTDDGFASFAAGRCDKGQVAGASCGVGCECRVAGGAPTCDCGRGLPVTKDGEIQCAVFGCGTITCSNGCTCADPKIGACSCQ